MRNTMLTFILISCFAVLMPGNLYAAEDGEKITEESNVHNEVKENDEFLPEPLKSDDVTPGSDQKEMSVQKDQFDLEAERRFRMKSSLSWSDQDALRDVLIEVVQYASKGDYESVIDYLSKKDRDRLYYQPNGKTYNLEKISDEFRTSYEGRHDDSFSDAIEDAPIHGQFFKGESDLDAVVQLTNGLEKIELHLVNEGLIMDAWRIDIPDTLTKSSLQEALFLALNSQVINGEEQSVIFEVLKTFRR